MQNPAATVIVRAKDKASTIEEVIASVRRQTIGAEILVVDSGSTDGTLELASQLADRVVQMPPEDFGFGRALNLGASLASASVHVALSAHTPLPHEGWLARALELLARPRVGAACGALALPNGEPLREPYLQDARGWLWRWGYSNTTGAWRAEAWRQHGFNEEMATAEDKEWAWRLVHDGWLVAYDPVLVAGQGHRRAAGLRALWARVVREEREQTLHLPMPAFTLTDAARFWWTRVPVGASFPMRERMSPAQLIEAGGRWVGNRQGRERRTRAARV